MTDWYDEMENAEQERDIREYEVNSSYERGRQDAIEELVGRILSNCTLKSKGEMVLEIRMDIFNFIVNQLKGK